jgi:predicted amidophosphoribosyltransferase
VTSSDVHRQCPCSWPSLAQYHEPSTCPRCGRPLTDAHNVNEEEGRRLRRERGLLVAAGR